MLEQHNKPLHEALTLTLSFKKSKESSETPLKLSTHIKLDLHSKESVTSIKTTGFLTHTWLYSRTKYLSEHNLYQSVHTHLLLKTDFTGNLASIWRITSSGKTPEFIPKISIKITTTFQKIMTRFGICLTGWNFEMGVARKSVSWNWMELVWPNQNEGS